MVAERELVGLLHRADWTKLTLSGTVRGADPVVSALVTAESDEPLGPPWERNDAPPVPPPPPAPPGGWPSGRGQSRLFERLQEQAWGARLGLGSWTFRPHGGDAPCALTVAPGRRFRAEGGDGAWAIGCDGERVWHWFRDRPAGVVVASGDRPRPPYRVLLQPWWLLTRYELALDGEETVGGRAGVRVTGTPRTASGTPDWANWLGSPLAGGTVAADLLAPVSRWLNLPGERSEVTVVVDAELGILLRCSEGPGDEPPAVTEFLLLEVGGPAHASRFSAPAGSVYGGDKASRTRGAGEQSAGRGTSLGDALGDALGTAGKEAAKTAAGIAAGGIGALLKHAPWQRRFEPFEQATAEAEDPEAEMPADEPPPGEPGEPSGAVPDEVLHLLYRSGLAAPSLRATLHQWTDLSAALAAVPASVREAGFGGAGYLLNVLRDASREGTIGDSHAVSAVAIGGWKEYRVDVARPAARGGLLRTRGSGGARTIAGDGEREWQVYGDRVVTRAASSPPSGLADLLDASWLLDGELALSGGTELQVGGRRAYRITARSLTDAQFDPGWMSGLFYPAVAVVDAETGRVLRLTRFKGGRAVVRQELRDVTPLGAGADFAFTPPAGLPVEEAGARRATWRPGGGGWIWDQSR